MYNWRQMNEETRKEVLAVRQGKGQPWHSPPHAVEKNWFHISAACYEHQPVVGRSPERMAEFEHSLIAAVSAETEALLGWCILPNHYHLLVQTINVAFCRHALGQLHGRSSRAWNLEDGTPGRGFLNMSDVNGRRCCGVNILCWIWAKDGMSRRFEWPRQWVASRRAEATGGGFRLKAGLRLRISPCLSPAFRRKSRRALASRVFCG